MSAASFFIDCSFSCFLSCLIKIWVNFTRFRQCLCDLLETFRWRLSGSISAIRRFCKRRTRIQYCPHCCSLISFCLRGCSLLPTADVFSQLASTDKPLSKKVIHFFPAIHKMRKSLSKIVRAAKIVTANENIFLHFAAVAARLLPCRG